MNRIICSKDSFKIYICLGKENSSEQEYKIKDILRLLSYECVSNEESNINIFNSFIENCFTLENSNGGYVINKNGSSITNECNAYEIPMMVNKKVKNVDQFEVMNILIFNIAKLLQNFKSLEYTFISHAMLSNSRKEYIKTKFDEYGINIVYFTQETNPVQEIRVRSDDHFRAVMPFKLHRDFYFDYMEKNNYQLSSGCLSINDPSELTIACKVSDLSYVTLLSPQDRCRVVKTFSLFSEKENTPARINLYQLNQKNKKYSFIGGSDVTATPNQHGLPPLLLVVSSTVEGGHQIVLFRIINTTTMETSDHLYGDWEDGEVNEEQWDRNKATSSPENYCLFPMAPIVDEITYTNGHQLKGRLYDFSGEKIAEGAISTFDISEEADLGMSKEYGMQEWICIPPIISSSSIRRYKKGNIVYIGTEMIDKEGYGILLNNYVIMYVGSMMNGMYEGKGRVYNDKRLPPDYFFESNFKQGLPVNNIDIYSMNSGLRVFNGTFDETGKYFEGKVFFCNCLCFDGYLKEWSPTYGTQFYLDGYPKYKGNYLGGKPNGDGVSYYYNNTPDSRIQIIHESQKPTNFRGKVEYRGSFSNGKKNGNGVLYSRSYDIPLYSGKFVDDKMHGEGTICITPVISIDSFAILQNITMADVKAWEYGKGIGNILYFCGVFEKDLPVSGDVVFVDQSRASVVWDVDRLVGNKIVRSDGTDFIDGEFEIKEWVITFTSFIRHYDGNIVRCGFYDNEKHAISSSFYKGIVDPQSKVVEKKEMVVCNVTSSGNNWSWMYGSEMKENVYSAEFKQLEQCTSLIIRSLNSD